MTDATSSEALAGLTAAVEALLPEIADPSVQLTLLLTPTRVTPTGLGGFVGTSEDPHHGDVLGRRLEAVALVTVRAKEIVPLNGAVTAVTRAILGTDRATLLEQGILRVTLDDIGAQTASGSASTRIVERGLRFEILYEFLKRPSEAEDIILQIPVNLDTTRLEDQDANQTRRHH